MTQLEILRRDAERLIAENPVEIVVHRIEWTDDGAGGRQRYESDLPPFVGRLIASQRTTRQVNQSQRESGLMMVSAFALIAPHDADLRYGSDIENTFALSGKTYKVVRVISRKWRGETYSIHAVLEEVS